MAARGVDMLFAMISKIDARAIGLRTATVSGYTATKAVITIGGASITDVRYLSTYSPTVGDQVQVLQKSGALLILGKVA